ncbi:MAG: hydroxyethylthiazole kinase [Bacillota bacterium]|nr:hydroxyethylthiazole kinase [Bacillota bacterium]
MENWGNQAGALLTKIREKRPLVHNITNWVVTNVTANVLLQIGALPVMAHAREEVEEMVEAAGALVLNIGTLTPLLVDAMLLAGKRANSLGVPVVFDPVGAGATSLRTETSHFLLRELEIAILRGNAGEISVLAGLGGAVKGVEAIASGGERGEVARLAARRFNTVVALTGPQDYISDGERLVIVENGHPLLSTVTGTGCMATAVIAAFAAVSGDYLLAAVAGLVAFGLAAERAAAVSRGPGSFQVALSDALYNLTGADLAEGAKITII